MARLAITGEGRQSSTNPFKELGVWRRPCLRRGGPGTPRGGRGRSISRAPWASPAASISAQECRLTGVSSYENTSAQEAAMRIACVNGSPKGDHATESLAAAGTGR